MNDGLSNIVADGMDAGLRLGESLDEHMVAVPVTPPIEMAVVGSPAYFAKHGLPETPADLMRHNCLAFRFTSSGTIDRWSFTSPDADERTVVIEPKGSAVFNDDENMLNAALQGVGVIKVPGHLRASAPGRRPSGAVLAPWCRPFPGFIFMSRRGHNGPPRSALMDFLIERRKTV